MTNDDRKPFRNRHPGLTIAIIFVTLLAITSFLTFVNSLGRAYPFSGKPHAVEINTWGGLACASPLCLVVLLVLAWRRRVGRPPDWACGRCGYDRRGVPDLSPCPECGAPTTPD